MADTIGWGDGGQPPHRLFRRVRVPRRLVVLVLSVAVVAAVVLWPLVRARLADRAAAWLQAQWSAAQAYDYLRLETTADAVQRAEDEDGALVGRIAESLDREERRRLQGIALAVARHRTYSSDVHAAAVSVRRALDAQVEDLRDSGRAALTAFWYSFSPPIVQRSETVSLSRRASVLVAAMARRHGLRAADPAHVSLTSAAALIATLGRVTPTPLQTRLAVLHDGQLDMWDLRTGTVETHVADVGMRGDDVLMQSVGQWLLIRDRQRSRVVPVAGGAAVRLPSASHYVAAADVGLWQVVGHEVRPYRPDGHPTDRARVVPSGLDPYPVAATANNVVLVAGNVGPPPTFVWTPSTGRVLRAPDAQDLTVTAGRHAIAYLNRDEDDTVSVMDVATGRITRLHAPASQRVNGFTGVLLSPSGRWLAAVVASVDGSSAQLAVFDVRDAHATVTTEPVDPESAPVPIAWSADDSVLIVDTDFSHRATRPTFRYAPLAYWTPGMTTLGALRIPAVGGDLHVTTAPLP